MITKSARAPPAKTLVISASARVFAYFAFYVSKFKNFGWIFTCFLILINLSIFHLLINRTCEFTLHYMQNRVLQENRIMVFVLFQNCPHIPQGQMFFLTGISPPHIGPAITDIILLTSEVFFSVRW